MRQTVLVFVLALLLAAGVFWLSMRAGFSSSLATDQAINTRGASVWGIWLLAPLPFVLVGLIGYRLYRSGKKRTSWKDGPDEWNY